MFRRAQHQLIEDLLSRLDGDLFADCECLFAGGTAISLLLDEYRLSDDIDFLCASTSGFRQLRERAFERGMAGLTNSAIPLLRELRADQYGIRAVLGTREAPVKFEIVREARIALSAGIDRIANVPLLDRVDLYAEKLLANADRGLDRSTLHRDLIDLYTMHVRWGLVPDAALVKARAAYGSSIDRAAEKVTALLRAPGQLRACLDALQVTTDVALLLESAIALPLIADGR